MRSSSYECMKKVEPTLEMETTPGEDVVKTVEMTTQDLEYYVNLVDKAVSGFESIDSKFEKVPP